ncbi:MAG: alkaline shock response membrane anchor protein AmaP [Kiritimatiellaceae bacterium]|nr:alkaline shock response membrane anchor protein AmaP [Kiritimatiellaceae bacterium]
MKKTLHVLSGLLILLTPLVAAGILMFNPVLIDPVQTTVWRFVAGVLLVGIVVLYLATFKTRRGRTRYISFESENGAVSISADAVCEFIRKLGEEFAGIVRLDPKIRSDKDLISIDLNVKLQTGSCVPEISQKLQDRVRESIRDGLGIIEVKEIKVKVQEIVGAPPPSAS